MTKVYRYLTDKEGTFSAGKRLLPNDLVEEVMEAKKWLPRPILEEGNYQFFWTKAGKRKYEDTLLKSHRKYLSNITLEEFDKNQLPGRIVFEDEWQVVVALYNF